MAPVSFATALVRRSGTVVLVAQLVAVAFGAPPTAGTVDVDSRDALRQAVAAARPGTTIRIAPGVYRGGLTFEKLRGLPDQPIVLRALDEQQPPIIEGGGSGLHLISPAYVELHHLVIAGAEGNGLNIDDGGSGDGSAHHVVLRGLRVRDIGPRGNCDGIKLSGLDHFVVADCTVERWGDNGSGIDMVGCHEGEIRNCRFRYQSDRGANGVQAKGGSARIGVRDCRFEHAGSRAVNIGGSTGLAFFRPREAHYEAREVTVEDCTFVGSAAPIAFVGVDGAAVRYNTIYRPTRWAVRILQETRGERFVPSRNGTFTNNVIAFRSDEMRVAVNVGDATEPASFTFADNYWYCLDNPQRSRPVLPVEEAGGQYGEDPQFVSPDTGDLRLRPTTPVRSAGARE